MNWLVRKKVPKPAKDQLFDDKPKVPYAASAWKFVQDSKILNDQFFKFLEDKTDQNKDMGELMVKHSKKVKEIASKATPFSDPPAADRLCVQHNSRLSQTTKLGSQQSLDPSEKQSLFEKELRDIEERIFSEEKIAYQKKSQLDKTKNFVLQNKGLLGSFNARISEQLTVLQDLHTQKMDKKSDEWFDVMNGKNVQPPYTAIEQAAYDLKK